MFNSTNQNEIAFFGIQRSGNHALINWIVSLFDGPRCFYNSHHQSVLPGVRWNSSHFKHASSQLPALFGKPIPHFAENKTLMLYSIENQTLGDICYNLTPENRLNWFGSSNKLTYVMVLRDPFNTFASRLRSDIDQSIRNTVNLMKPNGNIFINNWRVYAREFLGETNIIPYPKVFISFNRWVRDRSYREEICEQLGGTYNESQVQTVTNFGQGSSFHKQEYDGRASEMKLEERWTLFTDHSVYRNIFEANPDLFDLSERIFGHLEGTEVLRKQTSTLPNTTNIQELLKHDSWPPAVPPTMLCRSEEDKVQRARSILHLLIPTSLANKKFLDFGCGEGHVVEQALEDNPAVSIGYDIESVNWEGKKANLTDQWDDVVAQGPYDVILAYDVLDHCQGESAVQCLLKMKQVLADNGTIYCRTHPWCSRHGGHLYQSLNKAYAHLILTNKELEELGLTQPYTLPNIHPLKTYEQLFKEAKLKVRKTFVEKHPVETFFEDNQLIRDRIQACWQASHITRLRKGGFPKGQIEQEFIDYVLVK